jgi:predicted dehydrogenase
MTSRNTPDPLNDFAIYGSGGRVGGRGTIGVNLGGTVEVVSEKVNTTAAYTSGNMYLDEIEAFNRCLREGGEPEASGLDGMRACQVHLAIFQSARTGRRVRLSTL